MTDLTTITLEEPDAAELLSVEGTVAVLLAEDGAMDAMARRVDKAMRGALQRLADGEGFAKAKAGAGFGLAFPGGLAAEMLVVVKLPKRGSALEARKSGAAIAARAKGETVVIAAGSHPKAAEIGYGFMLRDYKYTEMTSGEPPAPRDVRMMVSKVEKISSQMAPLAAVAEGVLLTRDLVNAPANHLTTDAFAERIQQMAAAGLKIEVLDEAAMEKQGMRALLGVGQGSESPSYLAIMHWQGGPKDEAPLALVGKGVVFDTGGISIKPAGGMESMTMDMGGAGTVCGTMLALARRGAKANVVGVVGLVENMPDGKAQRPGDVVTSMKGDTIEIINTDAEGRLVLADALWYAQERFEPRGVIDLATLTGAAIVALGHENAAVFSNDEGLAGQFLLAAEAEGEGAWRMPLGAGYSRLMKSAIADVKNSGGRQAGAATAAAFLQRFIRDDMPWIHLDIAGTAAHSAPIDPMSPKGATGWGVRSLDRLVRDTLEA